MIHSDIYSEENKENKNIETNCDNSTLNSIMNEICIENFEYISHTIKNISDYHIIISNNKSNYRIYGYEIGNSSEEWYNENN